jgi:hypothetical protein
VLQWMAEGRVAVSAAVAPRQRARVLVRGSRTCLGVE